MRDNNNWQDADFQQSWFTKTRLNRATEPNSKITNIKFNQKMPEYIFTKAAFKCKLSILGIFCIWKPKKPKPSVTDYYRKYK